MKTRSFLFLLLALSLLFLCACVEEFPEPVFDPSSIKEEDRVLLGSEEQNGIIYSLYNDKTGCVAGLNLENITSLSLSIPACYGDYKIIEIYDEVFRETDFTHITLPEGLKTLGSRVFKNSAIKEIVLPNSLTAMGTECFDNCQNLKKITFGTGLTDLPLGAFSSCRKLEKVILPEGIETIGEEAFSSLPALKELALPNTLREIGPYAFFAAGTDSLDIQIPENVEIIGKDAFRGTAFLKNNNKEFLIVGKGVLLSYKGSEKNLSLPDEILYLSNAFDKTNVETLVLNPALSGICADAFSESSIKTLSYHGTNKEVLDFVSKF